MAEPKVQTIQQRFGFMDSDLKKPKHDEIMFWIDSNMEKILIELGVFDVDTFKKEHENNARKTLACCKSLSADDCPQFKYPTIIKNWEFPVKQINSKFIVGFVDMFVYVKFYIPCFKYGNPGMWGIEENWTGKVCFEVKTETPSLGELIRQIRMYQEYFEAKYIVVSPDDRFESGLKSQGIGFIKYSPEQG